MEFEPNAESTMTGSIANAAAEAAKTMIEDIQKQDGNYTGEKPSVDDLNLANQVMKTTDSNDDDLLSREEVENWFNIKMPRPKDENRLMTSARDRFDEVTGDDGQISIPELAELSQKLREKRFAKPDARVVGAVGSIGAAGVVGKALKSAHSSIYKLSCESSTKDFSHHLQKMLDSAENK